MGVGVGATSRVVRHGVSKEMTFKPRLKSKTAAAVSRSAGKAFWTEGTPGRGATVLVWEQLGTEEEEKERSGELECKWYKMRLQTLRFHHHHSLSETSSFSSTTLHIHSLVLFRKPLMFIHKTDGGEVWGPRVLHVPGSSFTGMNKPEFLVGTEALQTQHQVLWRGK